MSFDERFMELQSKLVGLAVEFTDRNVEEVNKIFIYCSLEDDAFFYQAFFQVNGNICKASEINNFLSKKVNLNDGRGKELVRLGAYDLDELSDFFEDNDREVPTRIQMVFEPSTSKFESDISYELYHSNTNDKTEVDCYYEWIEEEKAKLS